MDFKLIHNRTQFATTYREGDKFTDVVNAYPVNYQDKEGKWKEIDFSIENEDRWEFVRSNQKHVLRSYYGDKTCDNNHLVSVETTADDGRQLWVNFKLKNANPSSTFESNGSYKFIECFDGIDVEYVISHEILKENIILNRPTEMREFVFTLKMGELFAKQEEGRILFVDEQTREAIFSLQTPFMIDADGNRSEGVTYSLVEVDGFQAISVKVNDEQFLRNAVYPVVIDPPIEYLYTDCKIYQDYNFSLLTNQIRAYSTGADARDCALQINYLDSFKSTNPNRIINKIALSLYVLSGGGGNGCYVWAITNSNWTHSTSSSGTKPVKGALYQQIPSSRLVAGTFTEINITSNFSSSFNGLFINGNYPTVQNCNVYFATPYHATVGVRPILTIEYLMKPTLGFHSGAGTGSYYSDHLGNIFKYLDFGIIQAAMTTQAQRVYVRNLAGFDVKNVVIRIEDSPDENPSVHVELSVTQNPFVAENEIYLNGILTQDQDVSFYVRVTTDDDAQFGGNYNIRARAEPT